MPLPPLRTIVPLLTVVVPVLIFVPAIHRRRCDGLAAFEKLERNADDVRVFRREFVSDDFAFVGRDVAGLVVTLQEITFPPQGTPGDLLAE
jgi:hypothetical protein